MDEHGAHHTGRAIAVKARAREAVLSRRLRDAQRALMRHDSVDPA
jgi:hypothetical protein